MRPRCTLVVGILLCAAPVWAGNERARVRALDPISVKLLDAAKERSPTVRRMIDRLEHSDLVVYVRFVPRLDKPRAITSILATVPGTRYVMISVTTLAGNEDRFLLLGHELQHATELAEAPGVRDDTGMTALYERIGWRDSPKVYETRKALEVGFLVRREMTARPRTEAVIASAQ